MSVLFKLILSLLRKYVLQTVSTVVPEPDGKAGPANAVSVGWRFSSLEGILTASIFTGG